MAAITIDRGQTYSATVTITEDGIAKNISGYTLFFTVKKNTNDLDGDDVGAQIAKTITGHVTPASGITMISLTTSDTTMNPGTYIYDIKLKDSTGSWVKYGNADKFIVRGVATNRLS
jgi:hypothetical protein